MKLFKKNKKEEATKIVQNSKKKSNIKKEERNEVNSYQDLIEESLLGLNVICL